MKKLIKTCMLFSLILALTGCMKINVNMEVTEDLKTNVSMEMLMQESMLETMGTSKEEMVSSMEEQMSSEVDGAKVEEIEKTIDGETWVGVSVKSDQLNDKDIEEALKKDGDIITLTLPMSDMSDEMELDDLEDVGYSLEDLKASGVEMNFTIKMPGKVTSNVGKVDGDTVTIDLLEILSEDNHIENIEIKADISQKVSSSSDNILLYVTIAVGVIIVIGIIIFIVKKKKKNKNYHNENIGESQYIDDEIIHYCPHCGYKLNGEDICPQCHRSVK